MGSIKPSLPTSSQPLTRTTSSSSVAKASSPAPLQKSSSSPLLKSTPAPSPTKPASESAEVQKQIETTKSSKIAARRARLAGVGITAAQQGPVDLNQTLRDFRTNNFKIGTNKVEFNKHGGIETNAKDLLLLRYNPLASSSARAESNRFRAHAAKEFSSENPNYIDDAKKLSKMRPDHPDFDRHLKYMHNNYHTYDTQETAINISHHERLAAKQSYTRFEQAEQAHRDHPTDQTRQQLDAARCDMISKIDKNVNSIYDLMADTHTRYIKSEPGGSSRDQLKRVGNTSVAGKLWYEWKTGKSFEQEHKQQLDALRAVRRSQRTTYASYEPPRPAPVQPAQPQRSAAYRLYHKVKFW